MLTSETYRRVTCHSSCCSMTTAVANRRNAAGFGKISTTSARRLISLFNLSVNRLSHDTIMVAA